MKNVDHNMCFMILTAHSKIRLHTDLSLIVGDSNNITTTLPKVCSGNELIWDVFLALGVNCVFLGGKGGGMVKACHVWYQSIHRMDNER